MKNSVHGLRVAARNNGLPTGQGHTSRKRTHCATMNTNVQKKANEPVLASSATLRTSPVAQTQIIGLYLAGHNFVEIARQLHRDRRTVAKICRSEDVQAKVREIREKLLAESDDWAESINFAVRHETDGRLAYALAKAFGVIPSPEKKMPIEKQNSFESVDPPTLAAAKLLATEALRRGSLPPLEANELEELARTKPVPSKPKSRLFDDRD